MKVPVTLQHSYEFACQSAACRPPTSGGTGGSSGDGAAKARTKYDVMRDAQKRAGVPKAKRKSKAKPVKRVTNPTDAKPNVSGLSKAVVTLAQRKATNSVS